MKIPKRDEVDTRNPLSMAWWCEAAARFWGSKEASGPDPWDKGYQRGQENAYKTVAQILLGSHPTTDLAAVRTRLIECGMPPVGLTCRDLFDPEAIERFEASLFRVTITGEDG